MTTGCDEGGADCRGGTSNSRTIDGTARYQRRTTNFMCIYGPFIKEMILYTSYVFPVQSCVKAKTSN